MTGGMMIGLLHCSRSCHTQSCDGGLKVESWRLSGAVTVCVFGETESASGSCAMCEVRVRAGVICDLPGAGRVG